MTSRPHRREAAGTTEPEAPLALTPEIGDPIKVLFEADPGEARGIRLEGRFLSAWAPGLWWQPDGETVAIFAPWRVIREIETGYEEDTALAARIAPDQNEDGE